MARVIPKCAAYSPPSQGGATAPKARSRRLTNVVSTLLIRCASRISIRMLRDVDRTAPPAPAAPGFPALAKAGNSLVHRMCYGVAACQVLHSPERSS